MVSDEEFEALKKEVEELKKIKQGGEQNRTPQMQKAVVEEHIQKLAQDAGIVIEKIREIIDPETLRLTVIIEGKSEGEKQLNSTLCILTAKKYFYGDGSILSQELRVKLKKLGIKSLANLSKNLAKYPNYLICNVTKGSKSSSYEITIPGIKRGLELIKNLVKNNDKIS